MKKTILYIFLFVSVVCIPDAFSKNSDTTFTVSQELKTISAPDAVVYNWYLNDEIIHNAHSKTIPVHQSGKYTAQIITMSGDTTLIDDFFLVTAAGAIIKVYIIGDSTVCNYAASAYPQAGWGQILPAFFNTSNLLFSNNAIGGRSSRSFYLQGRWTPIKNALNPGDYVFIQWGHNDRDYSDTTRYTSVANYKTYITMYCKDVLAKGAIPVLVSPMVMNAWTGNTMRNVFTENGNNYRGAMLEVATALNVAFIDLNMKSWNLYKTYGSVYNQRFIFKGFVAGEYANYPAGITDGTHFQEMGAICNARMIVEGIQELSSRADMTNLINNLKPQYPVTINVNPAGKDSMSTKSYTYPAGLTVTLKTIPKKSSTFQKWNNASGVQVSTGTLTTVTSGTSAASYTALYTGAATCSAAITSTSEAFCSGSSLVLTASTGSSYKWFNGTAQVGTAATYTATAAGNYTVEVTTTAGCKATSAIKTITVNPAPVITPYVKIDAGEWAATNTASVCTGSTISFGPHPNLAAGWSWTGPNNFTSTLRNPVLTNIRTANAGTYTATYTDNNGCKATNSFIVTGSAQQTPTISSQSNTICAGSSIVLTASNGSSYNWFKGTLQVGTTSTLAVTEAGSYTVEVTNASGCKATSAATQVTVTPTPIWYADADNDGKGDPFVTVTACTKPSGYVSAAGDGCPADPDKIAAGNCGCGNTETTCLDCAGVVNGMAVLDNCSICVGGTTGKSACVTTATINRLAANIQMHPQPFDGTTTITVYNIGMIQSITIISTSGAIAETRQNLHTNELTIGESLAPGLYSVLLSTEKGIYTTRIVKK